MAGGDFPPPSAALGGNGPMITGSAMPQQLLVTGHGFRPGCGITIRVVLPDETVTYFEYTVDASGDLVVTLPTSIPHGTVRISATDRRPDPSDETGVRWTDADTVTW